MGWAKAVIAAARRSWRQRSEVVSGWRLESAGQLTSTGTSGVLPAMGPGGAWWGAPASQPASHGPLLPEMPCWRPWHSPHFHATSVAKSLLSRRDSSQWRGTLELNWHSHQPQARILSDPAQVSHVLCHPRMRPLRPAKSQACLSDKDGSFATLPRHPAFKAITRI